MNGYITNERLRRTLHVPFSFPQTELRAGRSMAVAVINLTRGQRLEVRSLTLNVLRVLTTGLLPALRYDAMSVCSLGVYSGESTACPVVYTTAKGNSSTTSNPNRRHVLEGPGKYTVVVSNNTSNLDLSVAGTGAAKLYF